MKRCVDCNRKTYEWEGCARIVCPNRRRFTATVKGPAPLKFAKESEPFTIYGNKKAKP